MADYKNRKLLRDFDVNDVPVPNIFRVRDSVGQQRFEVRGPILWDTNDIVETAFSHDPATAAGEVTLTRDGLYTFDAMLGLFVSKDQPTIDEAGGAFNDPDELDPGAAAGLADGVAGTVTGTVTGDLTFYYAIGYMQYEYLPVGATEWISIPGCLYYTSFPIQDGWTCQIIGTSGIRATAGDKMRVVCEYGLQAAGNEPYNFVILELKDSYFSGSWLKP